MGEPKSSAHRTRSCCPDCGCAQACVTTVMNIDVYETYDMTTGEMLGSDEDYASRRPLRTNRTVECRKCGRHYRIDDEVYEMVKW